MHVINFEIHWFRGATAALLATLGSTSGAIFASLNQHWYMLGAYLNCVVSDAEC